MEKGFVAIPLASGYLSKYIFLDILSRAFYLREVKDLLWAINKNTRTLLKKEYKLV
jgi:hypothetical protein